MIKLDWFAESQMEDNNKRTKTIEIEEIMQEARYHPKKAREMMLSQIDIALDNKDAEEFYLFSSLLLTLSK